MKLYEINPFIRFIGTMNLVLSQEKIVSYDNRMYFIHKGCVNFYCNEKEYSVKKNTLIFFPSSCVYSFNSKKSIEMTSINFDFLPNNLNIKSPIVSVEEKLYDKNKKLENIKFSDSSEFNDLMIIPNAEIFAEQLLNIRSEFISKRIFCEEKAFSLFKNLLIEIARFNILKTQTNNEKIENVLEYIKNNYNKPVENIEIAKIANYHPYYLNRLFVKYTGKSCHQYLIYYRLLKAKEMLLNDNIPISEIAALTGFESHSHFSHIFKEKTGLSPNEYKKAHKNIV